MDLTPGEDQKRSDKDRPGWRSELTTLLAEQFAHGNESSGMWVTFLAGDGYSSSAAASPADAVEAIAPVIIRLLEDQGRAAYRAGREDAAKAIEQDPHTRDCHWDTADPWWNGYDTAKERAVEVARGIQQPRTPIEDVTP